jgi:signal transduction histidine kinase
VTAVVLLAAWMGATAQDADRPVLATGLSLCSLGVLALLRRAPIASLGGSLVAPLVVSWAGGSHGPDDVFLVLIVASSYGVGRYARDLDQPYIAAAVLGLTSMNVIAPGPFVVPQQVVFPVLATGVPWALGHVVRRAADRESRAVVFATELLHSRHADLEQATLQERLRVARELHDVTAHTMSVVSLQAQVLRRRLENGDAITVDEAAAVEISARQAMRELRQMVGVLRPSLDVVAPGPDPTIEQLPSLVDECRRFGQDVEFVVDGTPRTVSAGLSLAGYRIVQECLTNARRHGLSGEVRVTVRWDADHLHVIAANGCAADPGVTVVAGAGLTGIRERVTLFGGESQIGHLEPGLWVVRVQLPIGVPV